MESRVPVWRSGDGTAYGSFSAGKLPNITADFGGLAQWGPGGAVINTGIQRGNVQSTANQIAQWNFDASRCSSVYVTNLTRVIPASMKMMYVIKYI